MTDFWMAVTVKDGEPIDADGEIRLSIKPAGPVSSLTFYWPPARRALRGPRWRQTRRRLRRAA